MLTCQRAPQTHVTSTCKWQEKFEHAGGQPANTVIGINSKIVVMHLYCTAHKNKKNVGYHYLFFQRSSSFDSCHQLELCHPQLSSPLPQLAEYCVRSEREVESIGDAMLRSAAAQC